MKKLMTAVLVSGLALGGAGFNPAFASGHSDGDGKHCKYKYGKKSGESRLARMTEKLSLSDEQVSKIKSIKETYKPKKQALREQMRETRKQLRAVMMADTIDQAKVRTLAEKMGQLKTQKILLKSQKRAEVNAVLTKEQLQKRRELKAKHHEGHHGYGKHH